MPNEASPPRFPRTDEAAVLRLRCRLLDRVPIGDPWRGDIARGFGPADLEPLLDRWVDEYDWLAEEQRIAGLPWEVVGGAEQGLRVVHQRADREDAPTVVLLHGWPDSVLRFERVLPLLTDVHVVVPALPGFPFSIPHDAPPSVADIAALVAAALDRLGHRRYTLSAGDVGGDVAELIADRHPDRVASMHLTNVSARHLFAVDAAGLPPTARDYLGTALDWNRQHGGYVAEQATRPRTLLAGLGDSPTGLAAWLLEKITAWTADPAASFTADELLTWVSAYWFTGAIGTSFATYAEPATMPSRTRTPTVVSAFAADIKPAPREWAAQFVDLVDFIEHDSGGHFAAWEHPHSYTADLRRALSVGW